MVIMVAMVIRTDMTNRTEEKQEKQDRQDKQDTRETQDRRDRRDKRDRRDSQDRHIHYFFEFNMQLCRCTTSVDKAMFTKGRHDKLKLEKILVLPNIAFSDELTHNARKFGTIFG